MSLLMMMMMIIIIIILILIIIIRIRIRICSNKTSISDTQIEVSRYLLISSAKRALSLGLRPCIGLFKNRDSNNIYKLVHPVG